MDLQKYKYETDSISKESFIKAKFSNEWVTYFMNIANVVASKSKDPSTKVGAIVVDTESKRILATGYNGFPTGVEETPERWERPCKYDYVVHAEANCIAAAARFGIYLSGSTLFVTMHPCVDCAKHIAASGIKNIFYIEAELKQKNDREWINHLNNAKSILAESNITLIPVFEVHNTLKQ